jgi:hypothetical protein
VDNETEPQEFAWAPSAWLIPTDESRDAPQVITTWSTRLSRADTHVLADVRLLGRIFQPWRSNLRYPLRTLRDAGVKREWPLSVLCLVGSVYDDAIGAQVSRTTVIHVPARKLRQTVKWAGAVNSLISPHQEPTDLGEEAETALRFSFLERELRDMRDRIARQYAMNEERSRSAMTGVAAFVVLLGLAVNNFHNLSGSIPAHVLVGMGVFLIITGLLAAANTVLRPNMRGLITVISFRQLYNEHAHDDANAQIADLINTGETLERAIVNNLLELTLQRRRLLGEFLALITGAACIGAAFAI